MSHPEILNTEPGAAASVTVVVPAYNAAATLDEAMQSIRLQTERNIEIIVVDDGSTDETPLIAQRHANEDRRIRLIQQVNGGVAAARNRGILEASSQLVAPIDADDIWHPMKLQRQLALMKARPEVALTFTAYWSIDEAGKRRSIRPRKPPLNAGFAQLCRKNFIGNGSSAMFRRSVALKFGGYDITLRDRQAQGCEDLKLFLQIAEENPIAAIREPMTGYRETRANMSSDGRQMLRSFDIVAGEFGARRPELCTAFRAHRSYMLAWLMNRALDARKWTLAKALLRQMVAHPSSSPAIGIIAFTKHFVTRRIISIFKTLGLLGRGQMVFSR